MRLRWAGDNKILRGATALECLRHHCHGDHSAEGMRGDVDGVMRRIGDAFQLDTSYAGHIALEDRCDAFVKIALRHGILVDESAPRAES